MPQMAPLLWLNLFIFFSFTFLVFFVLNYFIPPYKKIDPMIAYSQHKKLNWKW
uniref:ATP synthase complex subunit 8 n=1 Tax=Typhlatya monae TaxID=1173212 RepID=A0A1Z2R729_9EUCA|nr:ATP synthase F0 subunit 8 [Typhlatya monae]ASA39518.1 ATP synthase F0 subunit 8 [Typhlatya monae]